MQKITELNYNDNAVVAFDERILKSPRRKLREIKARCRQEINPFQGCSTAANSGQMKELNVF